MKGESDKGAPSSWGVAAVLKAARASLAEPSRPFTPSDIGRHPFGGTEIGSRLAPPDAVLPEGFSLRRPTPNLPPLPRISKDDGKLAPELPLGGSRRSAGVTRPRSAQSDPGEPPVNPGTRPVSARGPAPPKRRESPVPSVDVWTAGDNPSPRISAGPATLLSRAGHAGRAERISAEAAAVLSASSSGHTAERLRTGLEGLVAALRESHRVGFLNADLRARDADGGGTIGQLVSRAATAALTAEAALSASAYVGACSCALLAAQTGQESLTVMAAARLFELSRQLPAGTTELPFDAPVTSLILWSLGEILDLSQQTESGEQEAAVFLAGALSNISALGQSEAARLLQAREGASKVIALLEGCSSSPSLATAQVAAQVATVLRNIFASSRYALTAACQWGATDALATALDSFVGFADVVFAVSRTLAKLSLDTAACKRLAERRHLAALVAALRTHLPTGVITLRLAFVLGNMTVDKSFDREHLAFELGAANLLESGLAQYVWACDAENSPEGSGQHAKGDSTSASGATLSQGSVEVATKLIRLVANLATNDKVGRYLADRPAIYSVLADLLRLHSLNQAEELVLNAVVAVGNLSFYGFTEPGSDGRVAATIVVRLAAVICSAHAEAIVEAARALGNLSRRSEAREAICAFSADEALCLLLSHGDQDVAHAATGAIINLASDSACVVRLLEIGVLEHLVEARIEQESFRLLEPARPEALEARGLDSMTGGASNSYADEASEDLWRLPALAVKALENIVKVGGEQLSQEERESLAAFLLKLRAGERASSGDSHHLTDRKEGLAVELVATGEAAAPAATMTASITAMTATQPLPTRGGGTAGSFGSSCAGIHVAAEATTMALRRGGEREEFQACVAALAERLREF